MPRKVEQAGYSWLRQPGEGAKAYEAFALYRDMGAGRSYALVAHELHKSKTLIARWGSQFNWQARVKDFDAYIDNLWLKEHEKEVRDMAERQAQIGRALQNKGVEILQAFDLNAAVRQRKLLGATWSDLLRLITEGAKLERLARGEPTENLSQEVRGQVVTTNDEELARQVLRDPAAREHAREAFRRATSSGMEG